MYKPKTRSPDLKVYSLNGEQMPYPFKSEKQNTVASMAPIQPPPKKKNP